MTPTSLPFAVDHAEAAERLLRHGHERGAHRHVLAGQRQAVAGVHRRRSTNLRLAPSRAAGVDHLEVRAR